MPKANCLEIQSFLLNSTEMHLPCLKLESRRINETRTERVLRQSSLKARALKCARQKLIGHWYSDGEVNTNALSLTSTVLPLICVCRTEPYPYR